MVRGGRPQPGDCGFAPALPSGLGPLRSRCVVRPFPPSPRVSSAQPAQHHPSALPSPRSPTADASTQPPAPSAAPALRRGGGWGCSGEAARLAASSPPRAFPLGEQPSASAACVASLVQPAGLCSGEDDSHRPGLKTTAAFRLGIESYRDVMPLCFLSPSNPRSELKVPGRVVGTHGSGCVTRAALRGDAAGTPGVGQPARGEDSGGGWEPRRSWGAGSCSYSRRSALPGVLWLLVAVIVLEAAGDFSVFWRCQSGTNLSDSRRARGFLKIPLPDPKCGSGPGSVLPSPALATHLSCEPGGGISSVSCLRAMLAKATLFHQHIALGRGWRLGGEEAGAVGCRILARCPNTCSRSIACCVCHRERFGRF